MDSKGILLLQIMTVIFKGVGSLALNGSLEGSLRLSTWVCGVGDFGVSGSVLSQTPREDPTSRSPERGFMYFSSIGYFCILPRIWVRVHGLRG